MKLFEPLYDRVLLWSRHPRSEAIMGGLSFAESTFFPVPPDVMLIPMMLARPARKWRLALVCTVMSVFGGLVGWLLGSFLFELIEPWILRMGYDATLARVTEAFAQWGFWFILVAGFSPLPYKIFTVGAGVVGMPLLPFLLGSLVSRGARFFLEAGFVHMGGDDVAVRLRRWVESLGWVMVVLLAVALGWWWLHRGGPA